MIRRFVRSSIQNATVTLAETSWPVSLRIDPLIARAAELLPNEEVEVIVLATGDRFSTWVTYGAPGSGELRVHSGERHHVRAGDVVTIASHGLLHDGQTLGHKARVVTLDASNTVVAIEEVASG